jgi:hypothetical protein
MNKTYLNEGAVLTRSQWDALQGPIILEFGMECHGHCRAAQPAMAEVLTQLKQRRHFKIADAGPSTKQPKNTWCRKARYRRLKS